MAPVTSMLDLMNDIQRLQTWYSSQCNGDWEHFYGIKLETLDNPGWHLSIDLVGTDLENVTLETVYHNSGKQAIPGTNDWFTIFVKDGVWHGYGGPEKLSNLVDNFLNWSGLTSR